MKKFTTLSIFLLLLMSVLPSNQLKATTESQKASMMTSKPLESPEANALLLRLSEINVMDRSNLTQFERKQLRKEARSLKNQLRELGGGVYLSVGAIIIIVLLLILLL